MLGLAAAHVRVWPARHHVRKPCCLLAERTNVEVITHMTWYGSHNSCGMEVATRMVWYGMEVITHMVWKS